MIHHQFFGSLQMVLVGGAELVPGLEEAAAIGYAENRFRIADGVDDDGPGWRHNPAAGDGQSVDPANPEPSVDGLVDRDEGLDLCMDEAVHFGSAHERALGGQPSQSRRVQGTKQGIDHERARWHPRRRFR
jgi:hypothetical protein